MRRTVFAGIMLAAVAVLPGCVGPQAADDPSALVSVSARIEQYLLKARHLEFSKAPDEWHDATVFRIVAPKEWEGAKVTVYCKPKPQGHQMRQIGSMWAFKIEQKRIVGRYPGAAPGTFDEYPASEDDLKDLVSIK